MLKATTTTAALILALGFGFACTNTVVHVTEAPPDGGATVDDAGNTIDPDAGVVDQPDTAPPPCPYPSGPYGIGQGKVLSPSLTWDGYVKGVDTISTLTPADIFDCDGKKGINAVLIDESATWCGPCNQEAADLPMAMQTWSTQGVMIVTLMVENIQHKQADTSTALEWRNQYKLSPLANVMADPYFSFAHMGTVGLPMNILVDPRTMKIINVIEGYGGMDPAVSKLALKNKPPM